MKPKVTKYQKFIIHKKWKRNDFEHNTKVIESQRAREKQRNRKALQKNKQ